MQRWFIHTLADQMSTNGLGPADPPLAILIGGDCPLLSATEVRIAAQLLQSHDVVIGPAVDGGYYLIGIRGPWARQQAHFETLFQDIPWSTARVLEMTRQRIQTADLSLAELETREDIDTLDELHRLRQCLSTVSACDNTHPHARLRSQIDQIMNRNCPSTERTPS